MTADDPVYYSPDAAAILDDPYPAAGATAAALRAAGCKVVIAISHLGVAFDLLGLSAVPGIDIIVGSHSHTTLRAPVQVNGKIIVQAGEFGEFVGELHVDVEAAGVTLRDYQLHTINQEIRDDPALLPYLNSLRDGIYADPRYGPVLSQHVARAEWDLEKSWMVSEAG